MNQKLENPFAVQTPEDMLADDVVDLFVDVFADFHHVRNSGHTFLNGPRGSGKSMMFRYLEPDCQKLATKTSVSELPFFGVYVPIKNLDLKLTELQRLENTHAKIILNEHFLTSVAAVRLFSSLLKANITGDESVTSALLNHYESEIRVLLVRSGADSASVVAASGTDVHSVLRSILDIFVGLHSGLLAYFRRLAFVDTAVPYTGPIFAYLDFLYPLVKGLKQIGVLPSGPVYLLIDDADTQWWSRR